MAVRRLSRPSKQKENRARRRERAKAIGHLYEFDQTCKDLDERGTSARDKQQPASRPSSGPCKEHRQAHQLTLGDPV